MKPNEAATILGIAASTVRAWTIQFRQYFSPSAQGGDGRNRDLTETDVKILYFIDTLKHQSVPPDEIQLRLQAAQAKEWNDIPFPSAPPGTANVPVIPRETAETAITSERRALLHEIGILQNRIDKLEQQVSDEQATKEKLLREMADLHRQLGEAQAELNLYRKGRLKPE
jgi:DNA-binding transcriptional MerR regulator